MYTCMYQDPLACTCVYPWHLHVIMHRGVLETLIWRHFPVPVSALASIDWSLFDNNSTLLRSCQKRKRAAPRPHTTVFHMKVEQTIRTLHYHLPTCLPVSQLFVCSLGNSSWIYNLETSLNGGSGCFTSFVGWSTSWLAHKCTGLLNQ